MRREVEEGVAVVRTLQRVRERKRRGVSGEHARQNSTLGKLEPVGQFDDWEM